MNPVKNGRYLTAEDLVVVTLVAEAIRMKVQQLRGKMPVDGEDPLEVLNRIANLIEDAATCGDRPLSNLPFPIYSGPATAFRSDALDVVCKMLERCQEVKDGRNLRKLFKEPAMSKRNGR